jgi:hypothetical protein
VTLSRLWAFLAVALPVLGALLASLQSVDLAYHLRAGGDILDTATVPATDTYTFTAGGLPWQNQQWGAEVILAAVYRVAGWTGLVLFRAVLVGALFGLVFDTCRRGNSSRTAALLTLAAFGLAAVTLALRPQLFGMVLFALTLWLVARRHERSAWLIAVVPVSMAWANLHGSFFLAPAVLLLAAIDDALDSATRPTAIRSLAAAAIAALATVVNPFGVAVWGYAIGIATNPLVTERITEWQPTTPFTAEGAAFYASILAIALLIAARARRRGRLKLRPIVWLVPFALIGMRAVRGLAWWPVVAAVTTARLVGRDPDATPPRERDTPPVLRRLNAVVAIAIVAAGIALLPTWRPIEPGLEAPAGVVATAPPGITAALRDIATPSDRLFAPQPWGSWFEFAVPETPVFVDSRIELFPVETWDDYETITDGRDEWLTTLERWNVTVVVAAAGMGRVPLDERLAGEPRWREVYRDGDGRIFVRSDRVGAADVDRTIRPMVWHETKTPSL